MKDKRRESPDYWKAYTPEQWHIMRVRCLTSGCQYGIEGVDKKPKERCIWCGEEAQKFHFEIGDLLMAKEMSKEIKVD